MAGTLVQVSHNRLLAGLKGADYNLLTARLHPVRLKLRQRLELPHRRIRAVYFIESGLVSVVAMDRQRRQAEAGLIGREGMTGLAVLHGLDRTPHDTFVQSEGRAQCIATADLQEAMRTSSSLQATLLRFAHVYTIMMAHTALANARGTLEERLARWLLMAQDRSGSDELCLTHEFLSLMLGTRRAGVTAALNAFDARGWIDHGRARIAIRDRDGLLTMAGGLYGVPEAEYTRVLGG